MSAHFRLAPTPSGFLHAGNAINFLLTVAYARSKNALLTLRLDDLDAERVRPEYISGVYTVLTELFGHEFSEESRERSVLQSLREASYHSAISKLRQAGHLYACTCSRKQLRATQTVAGINHYPGTCRNKNLPLDDPNTSWRLAVVPNTHAKWTDSISGEQFSKPVYDFVIRQRNGRPAYQLASTVDDLEFGITHIVRGRDLIGSTAMQHVLSNYLVPLGNADRGLDTVKFWHHDLLVDAAGEKLSKRAGARAITNFSGETQIDRQQLLTQGLQLVPQAQYRLRSELEKMKIPIN